MANHMIRMFALNPPRHCGNLGTKFSLYFTFKLVDEVRDAIVRKLVVGQPDPIMAPHWTQTNNGETWFMFMLETTDPELICDRFARLFPDFIVVNPLQGGVYPNELILCQTN